MSDSATFSWIGTVGADWNAPTNWADVTTGQTPAVLVPGSLDVVDFSNSGFSGSGSAETATFEGLGTILGSLNAGTLVAPGTDLTIEGGATAIVGTVLSSGRITVSGTDAVLAADSIVTGDQLNAENGGSIETSSFTLQTGDVYVDSSSIIEVGQSRTGSTGALTVDPEQTLWADNGNLYANIIDNGVISGSGIWLGEIAYLSYGPPGAMKVGGNAVDDLGGTGTVEVQAGGSAIISANVVEPGLTFQIDSGATLIVEAPIAAGNAIDFDGNDGVLALEVGLDSSVQPAGGPPNIGAVISGFNATDTIMVEGSGLFGITATPFTTAAYAGGVLNLSIGANLTLSGSFAGDRFDVFPVSGPDPTLSGDGVVLDDAYGESPSAGTSTQDNYIWIGGSAVANWNSAANWQDVTQGQTPAVVAPGSLDIASVSDATLIGNGDAAGLTLDGQDNVLGNIDSAEMLVAGTVVIAGSATVLAATTLQVGTGAAVASLTVVNDSTMVTGDLLLGTNIANQISVDATSVIHIGAGTPATVGALTIDGGYSLMGEGAVLANLIDDGLVASASLTIGPVGTIGDPYPLTSLSGTGTVEVLPNGAVLLQASVNTSGLTFELTDNASLDVGGAIAAGNVIEMIGTANSLKLNGFSFGAPIVGFDASDTLVVGPYGNPIQSAVYNGGTLDLLIGTVVAGTVDLPGLSSADTWTVTTLSDDAVALTISCLAAGTGIVTPNGTVPIERLRQGDRVMTASGRVQPIKWIAHRSLNCQRHPAPEQVKPVRIAPHAFGENLPRRTLLLSPDHAVFVDDVLIPIRYLINDMTIRQIDVAAITYYHLELPRHDVLLAEGLPVESYFDTGDRSNFENSVGALRLYTDFSDNGRLVADIWECGGYAPLIVAGEICERVRARLAVQATLLGYRGEEATLRTGMT